MSGSSTPEELKQLGNAAFAAQDFDKAIGYYTDAIKLDPKNHIFFSNRSASYAGLKKWSEAVEDAKECLKLDPQFMKAYYRLATAQIGLKEFDAARSTIKQGLAIDASNAPLQNVLKTIKLEQKRATVAAQKASVAGVVPGANPSPNMDSATSKEMYELKVQHAQTVRDFETLRANLIKAERETAINEATNTELQAYSDSNGEAGYYQSIGKIFMKSTKSEVVNHLETNIKDLKKKQDDFKQKQEYLTRRMKSQQQNMQELAASG